MADATVQLQMEHIANPNVQQQDGTEDTKLLRAIKDRDEKEVHVEMLLER